MQTAVIVSLITNDAYFPGIQVLVKVSDGVFCCGWANYEGSCSPVGNTAITLFSSYWDKMSASPLKRESRVLVSRQR